MPRSYIKGGQHKRVLPNMGVCFSFSLIMRKIYSVLVATTVRTNKSVIRYFVHIWIRNILKQVANWSDMKKKDDFKAILEHLTLDYFFYALLNMATQSVYLKCLGIYYQKQGLATQVKQHPCEHSISIAQIRVVGLNAECPCNSPKAAIAD